MDRSHQGNSSWNNKTRIEPSSLGIKVKDDESIIKELFRVRIDHTQQSTYINQWEGLQRNLVLHEKIGRHVSGQATPLQDDNGNYLGSLPLVNQKEVFRVRDELVGLMIKAGITEIFTSSSDNAIDYIISQHEN